VEDWHSGSYVLSVTSVLRVCRTDLYESVVKTSKPQCHNNRATKIEHELRKKPSSKEVEKMVEGDDFDETKILRKLPQRTPIKEFYSQSGPPGAFRHYVVHSCSNVPVGPYAD